MSGHDITHKEIYDRLIAVERKVDRIDQNTHDVVAAFNAAAGAFKVLDAVGKIAKPILWLAALATAVGVSWSNWRGH